jgi:predicted Zn finger-like uncharacterized protein
MFRVVADQLKISEGWVRCGHCADVFDATLYLQPWIPPGTENTPEEFVAAAPEPEVVPEPESLAQDRVDDGGGRQVDVPMGEEWGTRSADEQALETLPPPVSFEEPEAVHEPDAEESDFHRELERFAAGLGRLSAARSGAVVSEATPVEAIDMPEAPAPQEIQISEATGFAASEQDVPEQEPGFVRQARRRAFWQSTGMRVLLSLLVLLLAVLLAGQWALQQRDRLAALRPDLQPLLQQVCGYLGCAVAPVRRIDAVVIDSTALVRRLGNFYSFDLVLKNTAPLPLAVPALELTLTDLGGAVIARRVFLPDEWPDAPPLLPAQGLVTVNFRLSLALDEATPMAGYGALLFYP